MNQKIVETQKLTSTAQSPNVVQDNAKLYSSADEREVLSEIQSKMCELLTELPEISRMESARSVFEEKLHSILDSALDKAGVAKGSSSIATVIQWAQERNECIEFDLEVPCSASRAADRECLRLVAGRFKYALWGSQRHATHNPEELESVLRSAVFEVVRHTAAAEGSLAHLEVFLGEGKLQDDPRRMQAAIYELIFSANEVDNYSTPRNHPKQEEFIAERKQVRESYKLKKMKLLEGCLSNSIAGASRSALEGEPIGSPLRELLRQGSFDLVDYASHQRVHGNSFQLERVKRELEREILNGDMKTWLNSVVGSVYSGSDLGLLGTTAMLREKVARSEGVL